MTKTDLQLLEACPEAMILVQGKEPVAWNSQACRMLDWSSKKPGVTNFWDTQEGLWSLEGDEVGLFQSKHERVLQGKAAKMRCVFDAKIHFKLRFEKDLFVTQLKKNRKKYF